MTYIYTKIPVDVKSNKNLNSNAKLLYGDISLLSHKKGYCYASNKVLSNMLGVSKRTITRYLKQLEELGFIIIKLEKNNQRKIYLLK